MPTNIPPGAKVSDQSKLVDVWSKFGATAVGATPPGLPGTPYDSFFFGPQRPVPPVVSQDKADAAGVPRMIDYMPGQNLFFTPTRDFGISFEQLDDLSRMWDLLRLVMETKKDKVVKRDFVFKLKGDDQRKKTEDPRVALLMDFFFDDKPDGEHYWDEWLYLILEDSYKWDAVAIKPVKTFAQAAGLKSGAVRFDLLPGNTILRLLTATGKTPTGQGADGRFYPAYRQIIKGVPVWDVAAPAQGAPEELWYFMRRPATNRVYGYSQVEQVVMTVNQGMRHELMRLAYFTEGNLPDYLIPSNPNWSPDQVAAFNALFRSVNKAAGERHGARFIPGGGGAPVQIHEPPLKSDIDEWYARKICYCFGESPTPFIHQLNRSTSETANEQSREEGTDVELRWISRWMTGLVQGVFGWKDIECTPKDVPEVDALKQAQVDESDIRNGVISPDAVAKRKGYEDDGRRIFVGPAVVPLARIYEKPEPVPDALASAAGKQPKPPKPGEQPPEGELAIENSKEGHGHSHARTFRNAEGKPGKVLEPLSHDRKAVRVARTGISKACKALFARVRPKITKQILAAYTALPQDHLAEIRKAFQNDTQDEALKAFVDQVLDGLTLEEFAALYPVASKELTALMEEALVKALAQVGFEGETEEATQAVFEAAQAEAVAWAEDRAAEMVGMRLVDGELIVNPSAEWAITDGTREYLRATIVRALKEGMSDRELAEAISENTAFSDLRAEVIARTETANADTAGQEIGWIKSGLVWGEKWHLGVDPCEKCIANSEAGENGDGVIRLGEAWPYGPPAVHPRCECAVSPIVMEEEAA